MEGLNPLPYEKRGKCLWTCIFYMKNNNMLITTHNDSSMPFRKWSTLYSQLIWAWSTFTKEKIKELSFIPYVQVPNTPWPSHIANTFPQWGLKNTSHLPHKGRFIYSCTIQELIWPRRMFPKWQSLCQSNNQSIKPKFPLPTKHKVYCMCISCICTWIYIHTTNIHIHILICIWSTYV